ncbi:MAG: hypothetical protein LIQ31_01805 [Planctomycetes bacterium]|nr:hypothetical protein [Planctomycetota bacterium]
MLSHFAAKIKAHGERDFWDTMEKHQDERLLLLGHFAEYRDEPQYIDVAAGT